MLERRGDTAVEIDRNNTYPLSHSVQYRYVVVVVVVVVVIAVAVVVVFTCTDLKIQPWSIHKINGRTRE